MYTLYIQGPVKLLLTLTGLVQSSSSEKAQYLQTPSNKCFKFLFFCFNINCGGVTAASELLNMLQLGQRLCLGQHNF